MLFEIIHYLFNFVVAESEGLGAGGGRGRAHALNSFAYLLVSHFVLLFAQVDGRMRVRFSHVYRAWNAMVDGR